MDLIGHSLVHHGMILGASLVAAHAVEASIPNPAAERSIQPNQLHPSGNHDGHAIGPLFAPRSVAPKVISLVHLEQHANASWFATLSSKSYRLSAKTKEWSIGRLSG